MNPQRAHDDPRYTRVMSYEHPELVTRLSKELRLSEGEARELFGDMKQFLYLAGNTDLAVAPSKPIDDAWHNFILFTEDYEQFCQSHFGSFIHHVPLVTTEPEAMVESSMQATAELASTFFGPTLSRNWDAWSEDALCFGTSCKSRPTSRTRGKILPQFVGNATQ